MLVGTGETHFKAINEFLWTLWSLDVLVSTSDWVWDLSTDLAVKHRGTAHNSIWDLSIELDYRHKGV